jgi:hypothetical protein
MLGFTQLSCEPLVREVVIEVEVHVAGFIHGGMGGGYSFK